MKSNRIIAAVATVVLATSCSWFKKVTDLDSNSGSDDSKTKVTDPLDPDPELASPIHLTGALRTFATCKEAESYIADRVIASLHHALDQQIKWYVQSDFATSPVVAEAAAPAASTAASDAADGAEKSAATPGSYTGTNNQVEGVDEADFVKVNGTHIFQISGSKVRIMKSWPAENMELVASEEFESRPFQLLLDGTRLIVLSHPQATRDPNEGIYYNEGLSMAHGDFYRGPSQYFDPSYVEVTVLDVSNPEAPKKQARYLLDGSFQSARSIGSSVRIVLGSYVHLPEQLDLYISPFHPDFSGLSKDEAIKRAQAKLSDLEEKIRGISLEQWLRSDQFAAIDSDGAKRPLLDLNDCNNIHAPTVSTQLGLTRVASLDLDKGAITETVLLASSDKVYVSKDSLYLSAQYYWWDATNKDTDWTFIHKFSLVDSAYAAYQATGGVPGHILNQFSMDEYEGNLRVATTITKRTHQESGRWASWETTNKVVILGQAGDKLDTVGETEEMGKGESIYGARFYGPRGFVITFRQTDPLFTLDLADATAPKVVGELKMPGFSNYMQMIDRDHLLAIGRAGDESGQLIGGPKISIFDISDMSKPVESDSFVFSDNFWTEAQYDHHAFTYYPERQLLAIPVTGYQGNFTGGDWWERYKSSLYVLNVDTKSGISVRGDIHMTDIYQESERDFGWWSSAARVSRSMFADDYVYAISDLGIRATKIDSLDKAVSTVEFGCDDDCFNSWGMWYY